MPLFEGHNPKGIQRLFIEIPDHAKGSVAYKWPDQQIIQHSIVNVDLDYVAVFTNLGHVIGTLGPGRHALDEGASLALGWLVDRLTGDAYYDAELYFVTTREVPNLRFGGPVDNLSDGPSGLIVSLRVFGELAYKVTDPVALLARLIGTGDVESYDTKIGSWVADQTLAAVRAVLPGLVQSHGVVAMGELQDATAQAATAKANGVLGAYGLQVTTFAELNVNLPDEDADQIKQLAAARAYTQLTGDFTTGVRGQAALEIAHGVEKGNVGAQQAVIAAGFIGAPIGLSGPTGVVPPATGGAGPSSTAASAAPSEGSAPHFCSQCGSGLHAGVRFCPQCGAPIAAVAFGPAEASAEAQPDPASHPQPDPPAAE